MKLSKNLGMIVLIIVVLISLALVLKSEIKKPVGVIATSIGAGSPCNDIITTGSIITAVGNNIVKNSNDFSVLTKDLEGVVTFIINNNPRSCNVPKDSQLNITVSDVKNGGIKLGTDLVGGVYYLFESDNVSYDLISKIQQRVLNYGISNTKVEFYNNTLVKIITSLDEEGHLNLLTERGKLDVRIIETIDLNKESTEFTFNNKPYEIYSNGKTVTINGSEYEIGEYFKLENVDIFVENVSKNATTLSINLFNDRDLTPIQNSRSGYSRIAKQGSGYVFAVPVELSAKASENYEKGTKNLEVIVNPTTGESYSKYPLTIFVDNEPFFVVPILGDDMGGKKESLVFWSYSPSIDTATKNMIRLKTILEMKSLPQELTLAEKGEFKPDYESEVVITLMLVVLALVVATIILFFVKFKKSGILSLPLILIVTCEIVIIAGLLSANWFALIILTAGFMMLFLSNYQKNWKVYCGCILFFILIAGMTLSKWDRSWVLDMPFVFGLTVVVLIALGQNIFVGIKTLSQKESVMPSDQRNILTKFWFFSIVLCCGLIALYFVSDLMNLELLGFAMTVATGVWINLTLALPVFIDLTKKFVK